MKNLILLVVGIISATAFAIAQNRTVTGKVTDKDGTGLAGVVIQAKGSSVGTFSKSEGKYKIVVPGGTTILVFKLIGKKTTEVQLGTSDEVIVALEEDALRADEVVVTAIGIERQKKSLGYATQEIEGQEIVNSRETNIVNALSSRIAGVQVNNSAGVPGASSFIRIRGSSSISGNNQPLFVIDGIPIDNSQLYSGNPDNVENNLLAGVAYSNRAIDIDPSTVASMNVLKGPAPLCQ
ncbi:MAG: TonB-dependent receptor plug domain-containing protein [Ignavibacteria bacterium]|nr:TonB-dependent receptor plug domain-containing protein [Ignavibacteria bacterium]